MYGKTYEKRHVPKPGLLPCPLCQHPSPTRTHNQDGHAIVCMECGCSTGAKDSEMDAVVLWQNRDFKKPLSSHWMKHKPETDLSGCVVCGADAEVFSGNRGAMVRCTNALCQTQIGFGGSMGLKQLLHMWNTLWWSQWDDQDEIDQEENQEQPGEK